MSLKSQYPGNDSLKRRSVKFFLISNARTPMMPSRARGETNVGTERSGSSAVGELIEAIDGVDALVVAERLRELVSAARVNVLGSASAAGLVGMTVSVGIATWPDCPAERLDDLVAAADRALYKAKSEGRNRCTVSAPLKNNNGNQSSGPVC